MHPGFKNMKIWCEGGGVYLNHRLLIPANIQVLTGLAFYVWDLTYSHNNMSVKKTKGLKAVRYLSS